MQVFIGSRSTANRSVEVHVRTPSVVFGRPMRSRWLVLLIVSLSLPVEIVLGVAPHEVQSADAQDVPQWVDDGWILYPRLDNGTDGSDLPLPVVVLLADDGRDVGDYEWVGKGLAENGIVAILIDWSESSSAKRMARDLIDMVNRTESMLAEEANITLAKNILLAGHGVGAGLACSISDSSIFESSELTDRRIGAIFGLGTMAPPDPLSLSSSSGPTLGFEIHLMGTMDEEADVTSLESSRLSSLSTGHHLAKVLGANHVQYLEDPSFLDKFGDGEPTMSLEAQHEHAMSRLVPFAELVSGRAVADGWLRATARPDAMSEPMDPSSYTSEKIIGARLTSSSTRLPYEVVLNHDDFIDVDIDLAHLGDAPVGDVSISHCLAENLDCSQSLSTRFDSNQVSLEVTGPAVILPPGPNKLTLLALVDGIPHTFYFNFDRSDAPTRPIENITSELEQRGSATINAIEVAEDPDGQNMTITGFEWIGGPFNLVEAAIVDGILSLNHTGDDISVGEHPLRLSVRTEGLTPTTITSDVLIKVIEKDAAVQCTPPEVWNIIEDASPVNFDLRTICSDPEGIPLVIESSSFGELVLVDVVGSELFIASAPNAYGSETLSMSLSDGTTASVSLTIPIHIEAMPDAPTSPSSITLVLAEDEVETLDLDTIVTHPDGANWTVEVISGGTGAVVEVVDHMVYIRTDQDHDMDVMGWSLNLVSDNGTTAVDLVLKVTPVNDPPLVTDVRAEETVLGPLVTVKIMDVDGPYPMHLVVVDGAVQHSFTFTCIPEVPGSASYCDTYLVGGLDSEVFSATVVDDLGAASPTFDFSVVMDVTQNLDPIELEKGIPFNGILATLVTLILAAGSRSLTSGQNARSLLDE